MKHFVIEYHSGHRVEFTKADPFGAWNTNAHGVAKFFVAGKEVDPTGFYAEARELCEAWQAKKEATHKKIRVLHGSSAACYVTKWVRK